MKPFKSDDDVNVDAGIDNNNNNNKCDRRQVPVTSVFFLLIAARNC